MEDGTDLGLTNRIHLQRISFKTQATKSSFSGFVENTQSVPVDFSNSCPSELDGIKCQPTDAWSSLVGAINDLQPMESGELEYVDTSGVPTMEEGLKDFTDQMTENVDKLMGPVEPETMSPIELTPENPAPLLDSLDIDSNSTSNVKSSFDDFLARASETFNSSINKGENAVKNLLDTITSSITSVQKSALDVVDNALGGVFSSVDQTGNLAGNKLMSFSTNLTEASSKATVVAIDVLRRTIVALEDSIVNGASFVVYYYGTTKEMLPPEIKAALNLSEERAIEILRPFGSAFQQVCYVQDA